MNALEQLEALEQKQHEERQRLLCNLMAVEEDEAVFDELFRQRDIQSVQHRFAGMTEDERAMAEGELRWETMCGCNGADSEYHTYFGLA